MLLYKAVMPSGDHTKKESQTLSLSNYLLRICLVAHQQKDILETKLNIRFRSSNAYFMKDTVQGQGFNDQLPALEDRSLMANGQGVWPQGGPGCEQRCNQELYAGLGYLGVGEVCTSDGKE